MNVFDSQGLQDRPEHIRGDVEQAGELGFACTETAGSASREQQKGFPVQRLDGINPVILSA